MLAGMSIVVRFLSSYSKSSRFGMGIYVYRDPSLADQYATSCTTSPYRVVVACDTLVDQSQCVRSDEVRVFFHSAS